MLRFHGLLKQLQQISVSLRLHLLVGDKAQRRTVDTVAHAVGGFRIVFKHMAEVRVSGSAAHLNPVHAVAVVRQFHERGLFDGLRKRRPAAGAQIFILRGKQRLTSDDVHVDPLFKLIPVSVHTQEVTGSSPVVSTREKP